MVNLAQLSFFFLSPIARNRAKWTKIECAVHVHRYKKKHKLWMGWEQHNANLLEHTKKVGGVFFHPNLWVDKMRFIMHLLDATSQTRNRQSENFCKNLSLWEKNGRSFLATAKTEQKLWFPTIAHPKWRKKKTTNSTSNRKPLESSMKWMQLHYSNKHEPLEQKKTFFREQIRLNWENKKKKKFAKFVRFTFRFRKNKDEKRKKQHPLK